MCTSTYNKLLFLLVAIAFLSASCGSLEQEVDIDLPEASELYVVESYLQPGQQINLLLSKNTPFFDVIGQNSDNNFGNLLVQGAQVTVFADKQPIPLTNTISQAEDGFISNYQSPYIIPQDYDVHYRLEIELPDGKTITSSTKAYSPLTIDSSVIQWNNDQSRARILTYLTDQEPEEVNYFRRILNFYDLREDTIVNRTTEQDFTFDDSNADSETIAFGTGYEYQEGDVVVSRVINISLDYYNFLRSVEGAIQSNESPFGSQPGSILSNITPADIATGIFTFYEETRDTSIIPSP